tara:strand:- start:613 stop:1815 length:1203 start_codon:yes stop_codon:yes gene_type:complete
MIENELVLKKLYSNLINDEDFDRLELGLNQPNIFEILRISKNEIRHSNFLSWLLNPKGSHGMGEVFLKKFLREIFSSEKSMDIDQIEVNRIDYSNVEIIREWKHIDLLIILDDIVISIENKVYSKEHSNQLVRYRNIVEDEFPNKRKSFVYLTPEGIESEKESDVYIQLSYDVIIESIDRVLDIYKESISNKIKNYLKDYSVILKREIMGNDKLTELSNRIYKNHKEILDFIFEKKPDILDDVRYWLTKVLKERGFIMGSENKYYVRFTTKKIQELTYYNKDVKNSWKLGESFLFEFVLRPKVNMFTFKPVISPSDSNYDTQRLSDIFMTIEGSKKPSGSKWLVHQNSVHKFDFNIINDGDENDIKSVLNKIIDKTMKMIEKYEKVYEENKKELIKMKNN